MKLEKAENQRGAALVLVFIVVAMISGLVMAFYSVALSNERASFKAAQLEEALTIAEAGIDAAIYEMSVQVDYGNDGIGNVSGSIGGGNYSISISPSYTGPATYTLTAVGTTANNNNRGLSVVIAPMSSSLFTFAAFSDRNYLLDSNSYVDSYDSDLGSYASQISGMYRGQPYARMNGDIGSNWSVRLDSNAKVFGDANPGPAGSISLGASAYVSGSTAPLPAPRVFSPIILPSAAGLPASALDISSGSVTIPPGDYHFSSLTTNANSSVTIRGPATIVVDHFNTDSNSTVTIDGSGGPVQMYGTGWFRLDSNSFVWSNNAKPSDLRIWITTDNYTGFENSPDGNPQRRVKIGSNAALYATLYAPNAIVRLDSNGGFFGAMMAKVISQDANFAIHYDEALARMGGASGGNYKIESWREIPVSSGY